MSIKKQNVHTMAVIIGSIINVVLNLILLKTYESMGAVISTVVAELAIILIEVIYVVKFKYIRLKNIFYKSYKYILIGFIMFLVVWQVQGKLEASIISTFIEIGVGGVIYIVLLLVTKDELFYQYCINKIIKKK